MSCHPQPITESVAILPRHVAIIMDGNGRWAQKRHQIRVYGHRAGVRTVQKTVEAAIENKIAVLTLFAFSSENWCRPAPEVKALIQLFSRVLRSHIKRLHKNNVRLRVIGDMQRFSAKLQEQIYAAQELTAGNTGLCLNIAANYGGQWDITQATQQLVQAAYRQKITPEDVTPAALASRLSLQDMPDVDLLIRTGGEKRISNFLLWQVAYAELYFTDILWPDFEKHHLNDALQDFRQRQRRFGGTQLEHHKIHLEEETYPC